MELKKAQVSSIELIIALLLFGTYILYISGTGFFYGKDYMGEIESALDSIYYSEDFRNIIMDEDLSQSSTTEQWNLILAVLDNSFSSYELVVANNSVEKQIVSCDGKYNKDYAERVISIGSNGYELRKIRFGVCY